MLVLTRCVGETLYLYPSGAVCSQLREDDPESMEAIELTVAQVRGQQVSFRVKAPDAVRVARAEVSNGIPKSDRPTLKLVRDRKPEDKN